MTDWLEHGWTIAEDAWTAVTDSSEIALGYGIVALESLLLLSFLAAVAPAIVAIVSGAPLWVAVALYFID
jgi:hypothetical protein